MTGQLLVASRKGVFQLKPRGDSWSIGRTSFLGDNCSMIMRDPRDGALYVGLDHGHFGCKMHRSEDGGKTWTEIAAPEYPGGTMLEPRPWSSDTEQSPAALKLIWALTPGTDDQPGRIWCGTIPGGLFCSEDRGDSWTLIESLWNEEGRKKWFGGGYDRPGIHSIILDPRDQNRITVGVSCGGIWESADDGASWKIKGEGMRAEYMPPEQQFEKDTQDPHLVAMCPAEPDVMWVQHHNGIFRSTDHGMNWTESTDVKPASFGFAVASHPTDPDTAWFVPGIKDEKRIPVDGKLVVNRTTDGGKTFEQLTGGLPQEHAYDLVFRHCLTVDETGERLAFGTTTGSLFTSNDGGENWKRITSHLPPTHVVQFA